jgi:hypothetical protein
LTFFFADAGNLKEPWPFFPHGEKHSYLVLRAWETVSHFPSLTCWLLCSPSTSSVPCPGLGAGDRGQG